MRTLSLVISVVVAVGCVAVSGCDEPKAKVGGGGDDIRPAIESSAIVPAAEQLCHARHGVFEDKRASCCGAKGFALSGRCASVLSGALAAKDVVVDDAKVRACAAAVEAQFGPGSSCDEVGPFAPVAPAVCAGVVTGALEAGAKCRSSLSCKAGLRCLGAGPVDTGVCAPPSADGSDCGRAVDALSVVVPQGEIDVAHPECTGVCTQGKCRAVVPKGATCVSSAACGVNARCVEGQCVEGLGAAGMPCSDGGCVEGTRCFAGRCAALKKKGDACTNDLECVAGCVDGKCAQKCGSWQDVAKK